MYEAFYQLSTDPFRSGPEEKFFFEHRSYARAKAYLHYALLRRDGIIMLTGAAGTGKTTLCNDLVASLNSHEVAVYFLVGAEMSADDFLRAVGYALDVDVMGVDKATLLQRLRILLSQKIEGGEQPLLIVDEAQELNTSALSEVRVLDNLRGHGQSLLRVLLVGNEQLRQRLLSPDLLQLHQRLVAACNLDPLDSGETQSYVQHRLRSANWQGNPQLHEDTLRAIHELASGIPRRINLLCNRLLLHGSLEQKPLLEQQDVRLVVEALHHEGLMLSASADLQTNLNPSLPSLQTVHLHDNLLYSNSEHPDTIVGIPRGVNTDSEPDPVPTTPFLNTTRLLDEIQSKRVLAGQTDDVFVPALSEMVATRPVHVQAQRRKGVRAQRQGVRAGVLLLAVALVFVVTYTFEPQVFGFVRSEFHSWLPQSFFYENQSAEVNDRPHPVLQQESAKPRDP